MNAINIFIFALNAVLPIVLMIALGYYLKRIGLFSKEFIKIGNKTVFRVLLPVLLFVNLARVDSFSDLHFDSVLYVCVVVAVLFCIGLLLACTVSDPKQKGVLLQCVFRSNFALIGVPLAQLIAGEKGVQAAALMSAFTIPLFNILSVVSLSVYNTPSAESADDSAPQKSKVDIRQILRDIAHNPLLIGVLAGVIVICLKPLLAFLPQGAVTFFGKFEFVPTTLDYLAKASTPVSLLVLGGQFELSSVKGLKKQIILGSIGRLLFSPLLGVGGSVMLYLLGILSFDAGTYAAFIALFSTPVAVASAIMAEEMGSDGQLAGQLVVWTTLFSALIIFGDIMLLRGLGML